MAYVKGFKIWASMIKPATYFVRTPRRSIICCREAISRRAICSRTRARAFPTASTSTSAYFPGIRLLPLHVHDKATLQSYVNTRYFGTSVFHHDENLNAVRILQSLPNYKGLLFEYDETLIRGGETQAEAASQGGSLTSVTRTSFSKPDLQFRNSVLAFFDAAYTSQETQLTVTHPKNEEVVKKVISELKQLTDNELIQVLYHLRLFSPCPSGKDPAFLKVWKEFDKECLSRSGSWSLDFNFVVADLWYGVGLARMSEYHWTLIKKLFRKCDKLKREHFVRFMFCLNLNREIPPNTTGFDLEYRVNQISDQLTAEEIVIIAMAFFKTMRPIRDPALVTKLLRTAMNSSKSLESVSIAAIAKLARYSTDHRCAQVIMDFQETFLPELDRLSNSACTHLALSGTNSLSPHKELVQAVVNKIQENIADARLKEMERLCLAATMFNVDCDQLCHHISSELQKPERADEIRKYGRCLPAILHYLSIKDIFIPDLMSMCLSKAFRDTYYGRGKEIFQRELLCLDIAADIEVPEYSGNRLEEKMFNLIMKKNMLWLKPPSKLRVPAYEKFTRSTTEALHVLLEDNELFHLCNILPQHHTMAVIYCRDKEGKIVPIPQYYYEIPPHHVKKIPINSDLNYHAIILCGRNLTFSTTKDLTGQANLQIRQTEKLGYKTQLVFYRDWEALADLKERRNYLENIMS